MKQVVMLTRSYYIIQYLPAIQTGCTTVVKQYDAIIPLNSFVKDKVEQKLNARNISQLKKLE